MTDNHRIALCPFCGSRALLYQGRPFKDVPAGTTTWMRAGVACSVCPASMTQEMSANGDPEPTQVLMIQKWNQKCQSAARPIWIATP